ncbi:hypothetical protein Are01nite_27860 [Actinoplanes regularis]|nr:hypothetical protein Are01nite_27860 [Actinoplanes regularis]
MDDPVVRRIGVDQAGPDLAGGEETRPETDAEDQHDGEHRQRDQEPGQTNGRAPRRRWWLGANPLVREGVDGGQLRAPVSFRRILLTRVRFVRLA